MDWKAGKLTIRVLVGCLALAAGLLPTARALEAPTMAPAREVAVAADKFTRNSRLPDWVTITEVPATQRRNPVVVRLQDTQFKVGGTPTFFVNRAVQVNDSASLAAIGQFQLQFVPEYQRLNLHSVKILRGKEVLNRTAEANVRFLQREGLLEQGVYSGAITVAILLEDVRVGDTLQVLFSVEGQNPVFGNRFTNHASWDQPDPVELRRVTLRHPKDRTIHWRMLGDFRDTGIRPTISEAGGERLLEFRDKGIDGLDFEPFVPADFMPARVLQFSEFADWAMVDRWAADLFPLPPSLPDELRGVAARIKALPTAAERAVAALQWVQNEIRYFSVTLGESSHRPHPPSQVLTRRYGDCKDKSYLLMALLRELGIEAYPALTSLSSRKGLARLLPTPEAFDHVIVQVRLDGRSYYLDPTRPRQEGKLTNLGPYLEGVDVLVVAPDSAELEKVVQPNIRELAFSELRENFVVKELGGAGTLAVRQSWHGNLADRVRFLVKQQSPEQLRKFAMGSYERRYPGIELNGEPGFEDDPAANVFTVSSNFSIPKLALPVDGGWAVRFFPANLQGIIDVPDKMTRNFPVALPLHPYEARYEQTIEWPPQVGAVQDPSSQRVAGDYFDAVVTRSFRGRNSQVKVTFSSRNDAVPAARVKQLADDTNALHRAIAGVVALDKSAVKAGGILGIGRQTLQESMRARLDRQLEQVSRVIAAGSLKGADLAEAQCERAETLADLGRADEGLKQAEEAVKTSPESSRPWHCRGNLNFALGRFAKAVSDYTKALSLGHEEFAAFYRRGLARVYLGRREEAAADFAKAVDSAKDGVDKIYAEIWQASTLQRLGASLPEPLMQAGHDSIAGPWPAPALAMMTGALDARQLIEMAERKEGDERELNLAEAWFYVGQHHLAGKRPAEARTAFRNSREKGISVYIEHVAAGFELDNLGNSR